MSEITDEERDEALREITDEIVDIVHRLRKSIPDMTTSEAVQLAMHLQRMSVACDEVVILGNVADALSDIHGALTVASPTKH